MCNFITGGKDVKSMNWKKRCIHICACVEVYGSIIIYVVYLIFKALAPFMCYFLLPLFPVSSIFPFPSHISVEAKHCCARTGNMCCKDKSGMDTMVVHYYLRIPVCIHVEVKIYSWTHIFSDRRLQRSKHGNNCARS